jgi:hypothetical protein
MQNMYESRTYLFAWLFKRKTDRFSWQPFTARSVNSTGGKMTVFKKQVARSKSVNGAALYRSAVETSTNAAQTGLPDGIFSTQKSKFG